MSQLRLNPLNGVVQRVGNKLWNVPVTPLFKRPAYVRRCVKS